MTHRNVFSLAVFALVFFVISATPRVFGQTASSTSATPSPQPDNTSPATPQNVSLTLVQSAVNLTWTASTDNIAVTGYDIYRNGAKLIGVATTTYMDSTVQPGLTYGYSIAAVDAAGNISPTSIPKSISIPRAIPSPSPTASPAASATSTPPADTTPPTTPQQLTLTRAGFAVTLVWNASSDNIAVGGYKIYRNGLPLVTIASTTTYTDSSVQAGFTYGYAVAAIDSFGNVSAASVPRSITVPRIVPSPIPSRMPGPAPMPGDISCRAITHRLSRKSTDSATGGDVSVLQKILGLDAVIYAGPITGYFGPLTEAGVKKFQAAHSIVASGTPVTTGFGAVGPRTRLKLYEKCQTALSMGISLFSPNGGEVFEIGKTYPISWRAATTSPPSWVALFLQPGDIFLRQGLTASSTYQWEVTRTYCLDNICGYPLEAGSTYKIEARLYSGPLLCISICPLNTPTPTLISHDQSDNPFTIATSTPK